MKITKLSMDLKKLPILFKDSMDLMNPFKLKKIEDLIFTQILKSSKNSKLKKIINLKLLENLMLKSPKKIDKSHILKKI